MKNYIKYSQTDNQIKELFLQLIKQVPVEKITVSSICDMLNINRSTFYRHFIDIYDLLEHIEDDLSKKIDVLYSFIIANSYTSKETMKIILEFIYDNKSTLSTLIINSTGKNLWTKINNQIIDLFKAKIYHNYPNAKFDNKHLDEVLLFLSNGYYAIYKNWIMNDCQEDIDSLANWLTILSDKCIEQSIIKKAASD